MPMVRPLVQDGALTRSSRSGDMVFNPSILIVAADANRTLTVADISGNAIVFTGFTAGRTLTTDTAANMLAANPSMDIGDSFQLVISVVPAFAATYAAGTGVTLAGRSTTPASSWSMVYVTKTSATAMTWTVL